MENKEKVMDGLVNALLTNLITLTKEDREIYLFNYNRKDSRHWAAIHISSLLREISGTKVYLNCSLVDYLWMKWKFKKIKGIKRTKKANVDIENELSHIENANNMKGIYSDIYRAYYHFTDRK